MMKRALGAVGALSVLALGACAPRAGIPVPQPFPRPSRSGPNARIELPVTTLDTYAVTSTALQLRGAPYREGGDSPAGFDCSGFIYYVFAQHGLVLPRQVTEQYRAGSPVDSSGLEAGDLVFFTTVAPGASHVGLMIGGDEFVHAPSSRGQVRVERLSANYWAQRFVGGRRILAADLP